MGATLFWFTFTVTTIMTGSWTSQKKEGVKIETYRIKEYRRFFCDTHFAIQLASKICKVVKNAFLKE